MLGRKAYAQGYAVVLFDWRAHGKTAELLLNYRGRTCKYVPYKFYAVLALEIAWSLELE